MTNSKNTKKALFSSVIALILCCSMLIGTTYAWFTDEVKSVSNVITAGNLDIVATGKDGDISDPNNKLFDGILWEPGVVAYENITLKNVGTLALKYSMYINFTNENYVVDANGQKTPYGLSTALKVAIVDKVETDDRGVLLSSIATDKWVYLKDMLESGVLYASNDVPTDGVVEKEFAIVIYWEPGTEDNNWNVQNGKSTTDGTPLHIDLGVNIFATQYTYEEDSFSNQYDASGVGSATLTVGESAVEVHVYNGLNTKVGAVVVDKHSLIDPDQEVEATFDISAYVGNFAVAAGMETKVLDIQVTNLDPNNTLPVKTHVRLEPGLDPATVTVYHYDELIPSNYDPNSGYVVFETTGFSPFTVVYDADSVYVPGPSLPEDLPVAEVVRSPEYENIDLAWGSYGGVAPTEGLDSHLEAAYTFVCAETGDEAELNPYANWYCDFYVELDRDLAANQIFLGGNYGSFGWVGFHNGDITLLANEEVPLLGSVTTNPWTYAQVAEFVGTFICGVGDVDDALSGATFTVMLRLTNPEDVTEFYNVATIQYTFE